MAAVAQVDTVFDEAEVNLFMAQSMGIPDPQARLLLDQEPIQVAEVPAVGGEVAELILKDMVAMAVCDRELLPVEAEVVRRPQDFFIVTSGSRTIFHPCQAPLAFSGRG